MEKLAHSTMAFGEAMFMLSRFAVEWSKDTSPEITFSPDGRLSEGATGSPANKMAGHANEK